MLLESWVNGNRADSVSIQDRGLSFGDGIFETMRIHGKSIPLVEYHFNRLKEGVGRLSLKLDTAEIEALKQKCLSIASHQERGTLKLIITRGESERGYGFSPNIKPNAIIQLFEPVTDQNNLTTKGIELSICNTMLAHQPQLAGIKHLNRLEQVLAKAELTKVGQLEGLMLNQGKEIIEGSFTNIFIGVGKRLLTPKLDQCGVRGTMREYLIKTAKERGIQVAEERLPISILERANEVFICNSNLGIWPVIKIGSLDFKIGHITGILQEKIAAELFPQ